MPSLTIIKAVLGGNFPKFSASILTSLYSFVLSSARYILSDLEKIETGLGTSIADFFKNNIVPWENSILGDYIKTTKQVGNNIIRSAKEVGNNMVRLAKKNIGILNYWDVVKENRTMKQAIGQFLAQNEKINADVRIKQLAKEAYEHADKILNGEKTSVGNLKDSLNSIKEKMFTSTQTVISFVKEYDILVVCAIFAFVSTAYFIYSCNQIPKIVAEEEEKKKRKLKKYEERLNKNKDNNPEVIVVII